MYKKISIITVLIFAVISLYSQNHIDALRYSQQYYSSTAKSDAMGNSLSAIGADFSAFMINPAGIAVFKTNQLTITPNFIVSKTDGTLSENTVIDGRIGFNFSNVGYVGTYISTSGKLKALNFGIAYNSYNDFRERTHVFAEEQGGSVLDFMLYNENTGRASEFREDLAWSAWLYDKDSGTGEYWSFVTDDARYGISQRKQIRTNGGAGEYSFTLGANINNMLYLGGTMGITSVNYKYESTFTETNFPLIEGLDGFGDTILVNPNRIEFNENLYTEGSGLNAKLGIIFQPFKFLRIGGAIHSSTIYNFSDEYSTSMEVRYPVADADGNSEYNPSSEDNFFEYRLKTPFRANAGIAFILDSYKIGKFYSVPMTFSIDYEYIDYTLAQLKPSIYDDYMFYNENNNISNLYKETHNFRAGAELNFGAMKVRGGYAIYSSPFAVNTGIFENAKTVYSGGLGFASEHSYIDLSYSFSPVNEILYLYNATDIYPNDPMGDLAEPTANLSKTKQFFKVTFGIKF